jgi:hypothetical protein
MTEKNSPKPKPSAPKKVDAPVIYDAVLDEHTAVQHAALDAALVTDKDVHEKVAAADVVVEEEVIAAPVVEVVEKKTSSAPKSAYAVVSGKDKDDVRLSAIVFENIKAKKSLSVHHLQRRLNEWGYVSAYLERDGWYGTLTRDAVHEFQKDHGLTVGDLDLATLSAIFEGDTNVRVMP